MRDGLQQLQQLRQLWELQQLQQLQQLRELLLSHGIGVGLRAPHYPQFLRGDVGPVEWIEVNAERYLASDGDDANLQVLRFVRERMPVVLHGTSMSLGSTDGFHRDYVAQLRELCDQIEPAFVSDHLCWSGIGGAKIPDLLPMPLTAEGIEIIVPAIVEVQDLLGRQILVENLSTYLECSFSEMPEWQFVTEVVQRADCYLLLDINNVYVSSVNHGWDPHEYLRNVPHDRVRQIHLAGHLDRGDLLIDTHGERVVDPVWELFAWYVERYGACWSMIERDTKIPPWPELVDELERMNSIIERTEAGRARCA
jgi:uncharacterized protein (UPF0276 family)